MENIYLTKPQLIAIEQCINAFENKKGSKIKFLHINGLDYKICPDGELTDMYDVLVSKKKKPLHDELGIHISELFGRICNIAECKINYSLC